MALTLSERLLQEVIRLFPDYLADPTDSTMSGGNAAVCLIGPEGGVQGHIFGADKARGRWCFGIATRKVMQVWATGYATGRFEELVYAGKLDEGPYGINRPDFIGWQGGVPFLDPEDRLIAAAFSGFRGTTDIGILLKASEGVTGLRVKTEGM